MPLTRADMDALIAASLTEKDFQTQVIDFARRLGWHCWFVWNSKHSPAGWPDLALARPPRFLLAELKSQRGTLKPEQSEAIALLRQCGLAVHVWRPNQWPEIEAALR